MGGGSIDGRPARNDSPATFVTWALVALLTGACAVHVGPTEDKGWLSWDVCGWEGGVSSTLTIMGGNSWRLGCTPPPEAEESVSDQPPAPPVQLPPDDGS